MIELPTERSTRRRGRVCWSNKVINTARVLISLFSILTALASIHQVGIKIRGYIGVEFGTLRLPVLSD
jgi:hypothetical protein